MPKQELTREEKAKIAKNEYQRKWRKEHRDRVREYLITQWAKIYDETHKGGEQDDR